MKVTCDCGRGQRLILFSLAIIAILLIMMLIAEYAQTPEIISPIP